MQNYTIYNETNAPEASRPLLEKAKAKMGFIPNLLGILSESPTALEGYLTLSGLTARGTLSPTEQQVVEIAVSRENGCEYCVAAHTTVAQGQKVSADVLKAVREDKPIANAKLEALRQFAKVVVLKRGHVEEEDVKAFHDAGYTKGQALEVILGVMLKIFTNYADHIVNAPLDKVFEKNAIDLKSSCATC